MRFKLLMLLTLIAVLPSLAQTAAVSGTLVDSYTGAPIAGATVMLREQGIRAVTGPTGKFTITNAKPSNEDVLLMAFGYNDGQQAIILQNGKTVDLGIVKLINADELTDFYDEQLDNLFDEQALDDEEGTAQSINALTGASDNIYYNASNYNFSNMYFRFRGYDSQYQTTYINGINMNDPIRGR
ncbi:MAG: carboxypeptidase-like regulatory domain-containing protein, partial [Muribaculaceae bacterium]|nr:carboxypeptidase-like regulatory domain-containing protein [Muribaculaceae bacterium]